MKKRLSFGLITFVMVIFFQTMVAKQKSDHQPIVLLDTSGRESEVYRPFIELAESTGFKVSYKSLDQLMDQTSKTLALEKYDGAFFILGTEFFAGLKYSALTYKVLELIKNYAKLPHKIVGFVFPSLRADPSMNVVSAFASVFNNLGMITPRGKLSFPRLAGTMSDAEGLQKTLDAFFYTANTFLASPLEMRPLAYHTTLGVPREGTSFYNAEIDRLLRASDIYLSLLPVYQDCPPEVKATLPYGLYWFNQLRNNHVFLTTSTLASFSGISESFHVCPASFDLRRSMHTMMQQMLWELKMLVNNKDLLRSEDELRKNVLLTQRPALPSSIASVGSSLDEENKSGVKKIAWMELVIFEDRTYDSTKMTEAEITQDKMKRVQKQNLLIDYILKSGLDTLWISLTPNIFYSPIARCASKVVGKKSPQEERFLQGLGRFTEQLKTQAQALSLAVPKIMVGFEIANNLYEPNLPKLYAIDLYGNTFPDLPAPLDQSFWNNEIKHSLDRFLEEWKRDNVSHGLKIAGVVLDLEMYCRKRTGTFTTAMGFDGYSFQKFAGRMKLNPGQLSIHDRVSFLMKNQKSVAYYRFLEEEMEKIGKELAQFFVKKIPACIVMCYMPNVLINWEYKGLCKGLHAHASPLHLLTFNAEFKMHRDWFVKNGIKAHHASVLLLSKIAAPEDFAWVDNTLHNHHAIWLNRFSRFVEDKAKDWTSIEQPFISESFYLPFLEHVASV